MGEFVDPLLNLSIGENLALTYNPTLGAELLSFDRPSRDLPWLLERCGFDRYLLFAICLFAALVVVGRTYFREFDFDNKFSLYLGALPIE